MTLPILSTLSAPSPSGAGRAASENAEATDSSSFSSVLTQQSRASGQDSAADTASQVKVVREPDEKLPGLIDGKARKVAEEQAAEALITEGMGSDSLGVTQSNLPSIALDIAKQVAAVMARSQSSREAQHADKGAEGIVSPERIQAQRPDITDSRAGAPRQQSSQAAAAHQSTLPEALLRADGQPLAFGSQARAATSGIALSILPGQAGPNTPTGNGNGTPALSLRRPIFSNQETLVRTNNRGDVFADTSITDIRSGSRTEKSGAWSESTTRTASTDALFADWRSISPGQSDSLSQRQPAAVTAVPSEPTAIALNSIGASHPASALLNPHPLAGAVPLPLQHPQWPQAFSQQFVHLVQSGHNGSQVAELRLDPPDLGPLRISIQISDNVAHAVFVSAHANVRQTVENALPQLQEQLAQAGISLGQASVNDQGNPKQSPQPIAGTRGQPASEDSELLVSTTADTLPAQRPIAANALVDTFA